MALPLGWFIGRGCGRVYVALMRKDAVSHTRRLFVPLALLLATYGLVEILGGYGFLAAFAAGHGFRIPFDDRPDDLTRFADFTESVDELAKAAVLIMAGALMPWRELWVTRMVTSLASVSGLASASERWGRSAGGRRRRGDPLALARPLALAAPVRPSALSVVTNFEKRSTSTSAASKPVADRRFPAYSEGDPGTPVSLALRDRPIPDTSKPDGRRLA